MSQQEDTKNKGFSHDEIDLRFVYRKIKQGFSGLWNSLLLLLKTIFLLIIKRWGILFLSGSFGVLLGIGLFFIIKPVYSSTLVLSSNTLTNDFCADLINNLNFFIKDKSFEELGKKLHISSSSAAAIKELDFDNYDERLKKYKDKDTVVLGRPFKIRAYTYNNTVFDTLQTALANYLENNEYAVKRKTIKAENINLLKEKLHSEIHQVDSLKFVIASNLQPRGTQSGFVFGQPIDPMNMFKTSIDLFKENLRLNSDLLLIDNIQIIQDFSPRVKPDYPRLIVNIPIGGVTAFLIGLIIAYWQEKRKQIV